MIDGEKTGRLRHEANKYANNEDRKAFLSKKDSEETGFVEVNLKEELPNGAPALDGLGEMAHLARVGVLEEFRGQGIGKALLTRAEDWAKENGRSGIWLDYLSANKKAEKLYNGLGYKDVAEFVDEVKKKLRRIATKTF